MSLRGNNVHSNVVLGNAIPAQSIANATVNGSTILLPWKTGRQLSFLFVGGAFAASASGRLRIQQRAKVAGTWSTMKENDGTTDLEFTVALLDDAGTGENGLLLGTLDLSRVDGATYDAIRVTFEAEHATATQLVAVAYMISDLYSRPSSQTDDIRAKTFPA